MIATFVGNGAPLMAALSLAAGIAALAGAGPAQAGEAFRYGWYASGAVAEGPVPEGYSGRLTLVCETEPGQTAAFDVTVGKAAEGAMLGLNCAGPVRIEGRVWPGDDRSREVTCTPGRVAKPDSPGPNQASWKSLRTNGDSITCAMLHS